MSAHPLGPWSQTMPAGNVKLTSDLPLSRSKQYPKANPVWSSWSNAGWAAMPVVNISTSESRTGVNNGHVTSVPSPATLSRVKVVAMKPFSFTMSRKIDYADPMWLEYKSGNQYPQPDYSFIGTISDQTMKDRAFQAFIQKQSATFATIPFVGQFGSFKDDAKFLIDTVRGRHNKAYELLVKNLIQNRKGSKQAIVRVISDHWLRYQFGIVPDIHDLTSLMTAFQESFLKNTNLPVAITGKAFESETKGSSNPNALLFSNAIKCVTSQSSTCSHVGKVGARLKTEFVNTKRTLTDTFGLGIEDFVPAMWELLPYSWLVDYFTNIGDFMSLTSLRRARYENGWYVIVRNTTHVSSVIPIGCTWSGITGFGGSPGAVTSNAFTFTRQPFNLAGYVPDFRWESPNLRQVANIAAVAAGSLIKPDHLNNILSGRNLPRRGG